MRPFRVCVLASGTGTNLQAIIDQLHGKPAADGGRVIEVAGVASDKPHAQALARGLRTGAATATFPATEYADRVQRDAAIGDWIVALDADLVVLAGYMQVLSTPFVQRFEGRVINVHPALLPAFPGLDAIGQALDHGVRITGVTVHFVDEGIDSGPIILQRAVQVPRNDDREALEDEIHAVEHELLPEAIRLIAAGRVKIEPGARLVRIDPAHRLGAEWE